MDPISAGVMAGGSIIGGLLGGSSAQKAADKQAAAQKWIFRQQTNLAKPYMQAGNAALNPLFALYGIDAGLSTGGTPGVVGDASQEDIDAALAMFYAGPEYTIQRSAADKAFARQMAAGGTRFSGGAALGEADIASKAFGDWRNNLASLASMGPQAAQIQGANLTNLGSGLTSAIGNRGAATSAMYTGIGQTVADLGGQYGQYRAYQDELESLRRMFNPYTSTASNVLQGPSGPITNTVTATY